jgi:hypothetical protein
MRAPFSGGWANNTYSQIASLAVVFAGSAIGLWKELLGGIAAIVDISVFSLWY